jgi:hypothetical protein
MIKRSKGAIKPIVYSPARGPAPLTISTMTSNTRTRPFSFNGEGWDGGQMTNDSSEMGAEGAPVK